MHVDARDLNNVSEPRIAFINPGYGDRGFWKDVRDTMQAAADQFGFDLVVFDSQPCIHPFAGDGKMRWLVGCVKQWHQLDAVVLSPCKKILDSGGRLPSRKSSQGPMRVPRNLRRLMLA